MDSQQFKLPTTPRVDSGRSANVNATINRSLPHYISENRDLNPRFPGQAPQAEDANLFTDYRPKCEKNVPAGEQFATRQWLQHNAERIIQLSRDRQATQVGAQYLHANTIPPAVAYVKCDTGSCAYYPGQNPKMYVGFPPTGVERTDKAPPLFGTYEFKLRTGAQTPKTTTQHYEGGRNSRRG